MTEAASTNDLPQTALEEKFAALEAKFAGLEKKYHSLHERPFTLSENSTGKATEISIAQVHSITRNKSVVAIGTWLSLAASFCERNLRKEGCESAFAIKYQSRR